MLYRIADLIVEMSPKGRTAAQAEVYRTSARVGAADITIPVGGAEALSLCPELETEDQAEYIHPHGKMGAPVRSVHFE